eukprot:65070-Lingulodinium_polyedra.AAC.1
MKPFEPNARRPARRGEVPAFHLFPVETELQRGDLRFRDALCRDLPGPRRRFRGGLPGRAG